MNGVTMSVMADKHLYTFNTLALRFQDEVYTLAYYLLADDNQAAKATETAFARLYGWSGLHLDQFRLDALGKVLASSRGALSATAQEGSLNGQLQQLKFEERAAVVLVDVLDLSYEETARVMNASRKQVARLLGQGRMALSQSAAALAPALP